jgi:Tol biopolymer transport system component
MNPAISRDGKLVAYVGGSPGSFRIFVRQIDGQRPVLLSGELDGDHGKPAWSPDGSRIAFEANDAIYTVPSLGGTPRPFVSSDKEWQRLILVTAGATTSPSWSPDGTRMVFANAGGMWIKPLSGEPHKLSEGGLFHSMSWSPDGQALLFVDGVIPNLGNLSASVVGVIRLDGRRTTISDSTHVNLSPVWMPDGRTILYVSNRDGSLDVYEQRLDRDLRPDGAPQRITTGLSVRTISVSADGSRLAYDVVRNRSNLWQIPIPQTGVASFATAKQITTENQRIESFTVSHDGQWLAYDSDRNGNADIYKIRIDGTGEAIQLTKDLGNDFAPSWSPTDRELAFHSSRSGVRRIYIVDAEGNNEHRVTAEGEDAFAPDWSPDGTRIVIMTSFGNNRGDAMISRQADGNWSAPRRITQPTDQATWPRWSPDGRLIAYPLLRRDAPTALAVQSADGGPARIVVAPSSADGGVLWTAWSRDPNVLYYSTSSRSGRTAFWSVPVTGGTPRLLFRDDETHRISRFDFATDGKRLFLNFAADESDVYVVELKR